MHFKEAKTLLSAKNGMDIYRGCTHGCIYCDSRSACYKMDHDFEDIEVKINAPALLEDALRRRKKRCMIGTGSMCDPYMPPETELNLTRQCSQIIEHYGFGLTVITKSDAVLRDLDLLKSINEKSKCVVQMTLTTHDEATCRIIEPHVATSVKRYETLLKLKEAGIPTVVWLCPILPFLNDTPRNITGLIEYCADAGVKGVLNFGMGLTLREGNRAYFYEKLDAHFPGLSKKYRSEYGNAYVCASPDNARLSGLFHALCERYGILHDNNAIFQYLKHYEDKTAGTQLNLFDTP
jgi:DNA repair photolyase